MNRAPAPHEKVNGRSAEVAALLAAARGVLEHRSFAGAVRTVLRICQTILGADAGLVGVRTPDGASFEIAALDPGSLALDPAAGLPPSLRRLSARCAKGKTVRANGLSARRAKADPPRPRSGPRSALVAPILLDGEVAGILGLLDKPGGFTAADAQLAEVFAELAAVAMHESRALSGTHEAEQRTRTMANALREATVALTRSLDRETVLVTLLDRLRGMIPFDRASVMLVEEASRLSVRAVFDGQRSFPLTAELRSAVDPTDHPLVQAILTTGTAVLISDVHAHPDWRFPMESAPEASWLGVPLFARGDVAGLLSLSKREPGSFSGEHLRLAEAMSAQASVAVENAILFEQMQAATLRMQALSRRLVDAHETERRHIARELHDEAGQTLVSLRYGLRLLEREIEEGGRVSGRVGELVKRTDAVIDGLHRLAADLRPASLDHLGLEAALRQYLQSAESKYGLTIRFKAHGFTAERRLPAAVETALYRVVQEALTNVVRHAGATRVDVLARLSDGRVRVMVEDDGVGFEPDRAQRGDRVGLLGMRERAEALGGTLTVESAPGAGATVVVEVPSVDPHPDR